MTEPTGKMLEAHTDTNIQPGLNNGEKKRKNTHSLA